MDAIEKWVGWVGVAAGLVTLAVALWWAVWRGLRRPSRRQTGLADKALHLPLQAIFAVLWIGLCLLLWRSVPLALSTPARVIALLVGGLLYFPGLALYLWGAKTLGEMYRASSGLGVQLNVEHKLVTYGPFNFVRHPLYLGLQIAALGGFLLYRTWTLVFVVVNFFGLIFRARREEQALAAEFGEEWEVYTRRVPAWLPRLRR